MPTVSATCTPHRILSPQQCWGFSLPPLQGSFFPAPLQAPFFPPPQGILRTRRRTGYVNVASRTQSCSSMPSHQNRISCGILLSTPCTATPSFLMHLFPPSSTNRPLSPSPPPPAGNRTNTLRERHLFSAVPRPQRPYRTLEKQGHCPGRLCSRSQRVFSTAAADSQIAGRRDRAETTARARQSHPET